MVAVADALSSLSSPPALTHFPLSNSSSSKLYSLTIPSFLRPFSSSISASTPSSDPISPPSSKKVLIPIGFGTEEMEAVVMIDVLRRAGAEVTVASVESQLQVEAFSGVRIVVDTCISKCRNEVFDLVALPGGVPGSARLRNCEILRQITSRQADGKRLYGAICAAPAVTLLPWGLLKRKQVLIPIANGSEVIEVVTIADVLRRAKMDVVLASVVKSQQILASQDTRIIAGRTIRHRESLQIQNLEKAAERAKFIRKDMSHQRAAAHDSGITDFHSERESAAKVVIDGNVITCRGLASAMEFALTIVNKIFGQGRARSVAEGLVFDYSSNLN